MKSYMKSATCRLGIALTAVLTIGCSGRPSILPNPDKELRLSSAQFAADAVKRHPHNASAPRGGEAAARAQVDYVLNRLEVVNLSDENWKDVEVWVNRAYVVYVPVMESRELKVLPFQMIFDDQGHYLPTDWNKEKVNNVELYRDGTMYEVRVQLAD